ncbi:type I secretion system permease/ATPase [Aquabacterium sp.]|uniref:type I secretion system permease/ATPase n=1 Tax=Aquabacterium sp. TaxID=1872578 RepID=UPI0035B1246D
MDNPYELPEQEPQLAEFMPTEEPIAAPVRNDGDPLLEAVLWLCRHHGVDRSEQSLMEGQAVQGILTPDQALKVLKQAGFSATLVRRSPGKILSLLMPVIMLLKNGDACIVMRRLSARSKRSGEDRYEVIMPGADEEVVTATEDELMSEYSGYTIIAALKPGMRASKAAAVEEESGHWLWDTLKRFVPYYRSAMLAALLSNILMIVTGLFTSVVYDRVIPNKAFVTLWSLGAGTLIAIAFDLAARQLRSYLIDAAGKKADIALGSLIFRQAMGIKLEHRPESAGAFAHRLAQIEVVRDFSTSATISALTDLPFIFLFVLVTWLVAGPMVLVLLITVPLVLGLTWVIQGILRRYTRANMNQQAELHGVLIESVEGLEDVRAAGAQGHFIQRYEDASAVAAMSALRTRSMASWVNNFAMVAQQLITVVMLLWGVHLIDAGQLTGGALIAAVMFGGRAIAPLGSVVNLASRYQSAKAALLSLDQLMKLPTERDLSKRYLARPKLQGQLALHDVRFAYPKGTQEHAPMVLKGVSLNIKAGERVALLGKIGSGKSTILRLLGGLYQPGDGFVEIDGIDLRQIDPADFRSHVGFVSQEPRLFQGTLRDNVMLGRANADVAHFLDVAKLTGLDKIAAAHPLGYDLPVGEGGSLLSGGQRQLVALARCLVTHPQILLLDEPTSSMDAQAETSFIKHLKTAVGDRTLVVVTHRPALLDVVDRVIVVDGGRILADGPKAAVLAALAGQRPPTGPTPVPSNPAQPVVPQAAVPGAA